MVKKRGVVMKQKRLVTALTMIFATMLISTSLFAGVFFQVDFQKNLNESLNQWISSKAHVKMSAGDEQTHFVNMVVNKINWWAYTIKIIPSDLVEMEKGKGPYSDFIFVSILPKEGGEWGGYEVDATNFKGFDVTLKLNHKKFTSKEIKHFLTKHWRYTKRT